MSKVYYSYNYISYSSINLANDIKKSFEPDYILAISGGGLIPSRIIRKVIDKPIISLTIKYYDDNDKIMETPNIIQWVDRELIENKKILIVDEIDDTGKTLDFIINRLKEFNPKELCLGVIFNKKKEKAYNFEGIKYFCSEEIDDNWVVFPWE